MVACYSVTQSGCSTIMAQLVASLDFSNDLDYEECAPLATFESAIKVILFEFEEKVLNRQSFASEVSGQDSSDVRQTIVTWHKKEIEKLKSATKKKHLIKDMVLSTCEVRDSTTRISYVSPIVKRDSALFASQLRKTFNLPEFNATP